MKQQSNLRYLVVLVLIISAPSVLALAWFYYTKDPNLRPLGLTVEALQNYAGIGPGIEIVAVVDGINSSISEEARNQLRATLETAFQAKGVDVRVVMHEGAGSPRITYNVGKTILGPYPTSQASVGISEAVEAFRMHTQPSQ